MTSSMQKERKATGAEAPSSSDDVLVGPLFRSWPDIRAIVLSHMDPVDRSLFAGVSPSISDAVMKSENPSDWSDRLPVAGVTPGFGLDEFTDSLKKFRYGVLTYPELLSYRRGLLRRWFVRRRRLKETLMCCARPEQSGVC